MEQLWILLLAIGICVLTIVLLTAVNYFELYSLKLRREKSGYDEHEIYETLKAKEVPRYVSEQILEKFKNVTNVKNFPVFLEDEISNLYGICGEDFTELVFELSEKCNLLLGKDTNIKHILTVEDLVLFLAQLPKKNQKN